MTAKNALATSVQDAQRALADALAARITGHVDRLNTQGCPPVTAAAALDLWAHVRRHMSPETDPVAARLVIRALDLGWRPSAAAPADDGHGTPPLPLGDD